MRHDGYLHRCIIKFSFNSLTVYSINQQENVHDQWQGHVQLPSAEMQIETVKFYSIEVKFILQRYEISISIHLRFF